MCLCGQFWQIQSQFNQAIKSNHHLISFKLHLTSSTTITSKNPVYPLYIFDYYKGSCDGLNDFLNNVDFCTCYQSNNMKCIWSYIKSTLCNLWKSLLHLSNKMLPTTPNISLHLYNTRWIVFDHSKRNITNLLLIQTWYTSIMQRTFLLIK